VTSANPTGPAANSYSAVRLAFSAPVDLTSLRAAGAVTLTGPSGQLIPISAINPVANSNGLQVDVTFATQTAPGSYLLTVAATVKDTAGNHLAAAYKTAFSIANPAGVYTNSTAVAIPDLGIAISPITISQDVVIRSIQIQLNIRHTFDGDLYIHLVAPNGLDILLSNRRGGSGDNYQNTLFDDNGPTSIRLAAPPFAGTFQPEAQLANLLGMSARGTWRLWVEDRAAGDTGTLLSWSIMLNGAAPPVKPGSATSPVSPASLQSLAGEPPAAPSAPPPGAAPSAEGWAALAQALAGTDPGAKPPPGHAGDALFGSAAAVNQVHTEFLLNAPPPGHPLTTTEDLEG
jgi:subtilisin-like proprotein convertase family protein